MSQQLQPDGSWPPFVAPSPGGVDAGYGRVASYVSPQCLQRLGAFFPGGVRQQVGGGARHEVDARVAELLYDQLAATGVRYAHEEWDLGTGQRVRDPERLLWGRGEGTCLDLAVLYAGLCLMADLQVALVLLRRQDGSGHVLVAVRPGASADADLPSLHGTSPVGTGVLELFEPDDLPGQEDLVVVDVVGATQGLTFSRAVTREALQGGDYPVAHLVDVAARHRAGDHPLPPPQALSALSNDLPVPALAQLDVPRAAAGSELEEPLLMRLSRARGVVVLRGASGTGKTTLALRAAAAVDRGKGWLLGASSRTTLRAALAERELAERGSSLGPLEPEEAGGLASSALQRLRTLDRPWVVVVDNADGGPADLAAVLAVARPEQGQLVIVTSTAPSQSWAGYEVLEIVELSEAAAATALPDVRLARLSAGRLVLVTALQTLLRHHPALLERTDVRSLLDVHMDAVVGADDPDARAARGADLFVQLLLAAVGDDGAEGELLRTLPWLPPDRLPRSSLAGLLSVPDDASETLGRLVDAGLLTRLQEPHPTDGQSLALHRLLQAALQRRAGSDSELLVRVLPQPEVQRLLLAAGDRDLLAVIGRQLDTVVSVPGSGRALWSLAVIRELHDGDRSASTFRQAEDHLSANDPVERPLLADCLHARARVVNQMKDDRRTKEDLLAARAWVRRALELRDEADLVGRAKHQALDALLRKALSRAMPPVERAAELEQVLDLLRESYELRAQALRGQDHPLVDRARYNLAGASVALAQVASEPARAAELVRDAEDIYRECLRYRQSFYGRPNPLVASCQWGTGVAQYVAAVLGLAPAVPLLRAATTATLESLLEREQLASQDADSDDVGKSVRLLAKIATARYLLTVHEAGRATARVDLTDELDGEWPVSAATTGSAGD